MNKKVVQILGLLIFAHVQLFGLAQYHLLDDEMVEICRPDLSFVNQKKRYVSQGLLAKMAHHKVNFVWPVKFCQCWISSLFGWRKSGYHAGVDFAAKKGTAVFAAMDGTVEKISRDLDVKGYGNMILLKHSHGYKTRYAHLDAIAVDQIGQIVKQGQEIGKVGATGHVVSNTSKGDASHLHFEILHHGQPCDPLSYLFASQ